MGLDITIIEKLKALLSKVRGLGHEVSLFTVMQREDSDSWDLVFAGDNLRTKENLDTIVKLIKDIFEENEVPKFPRLILLNSDNIFAKSINKAFAMEGGSIRIKNSQVDDILIKDAYLLYSKNISVPLKKVEYLHKGIRSVKIKNSTTSASGQVDINELTKYDEKE